MANIREIRQIKDFDLKRLCVANGWFNKGNNKQYKDFLKWADGLPNISAVGIVEIAKVIKEHSETAYSIEDICFDLAKACFSKFETTTEQGKAPEMAEAEAVAHDSIKIVPSEGEGLGCFKVFVNGVEDANIRNVRIEMGVDNRTPVVTLEKYCDEVAADLGKCLVASTFYRDIPDKYRQ